VQISGVKGFLLTVMSSVAIKQQTPKQVAQVCLAWILAVPSQIIFFRIGPRVFKTSSLSIPGPN